MTWIRFLLMLYFFIVAHKAASQTLLKAFLKSMSLYLTFDSIRFRQDISFLGLRFFITAVFHVHIIVIEVVAQQILQFFRIKASSFVQCLRQRSSRHLKRTPCSLPVFLIETPTHFQELFLTEITEICNNTTPLEEGVEVT